MENHFESFKENRTSVFICSGLISQTLKLMFFNLNRTCLPAPLLEKSICESRWSQGSLSCLIAVISNRGFQQSLSIIIIKSYLTFNIGLKNLETLSIKIASKTFIWIFYSLLCLAVLFLNFYPFWFILLTLKWCQITNWMWKRICHAIWSKGMPVTYSHQWHKFLTNLMHNSLTVVLNFATLHILRLDFHT